MSDNSVIEIDDDTNKIEIEVDKIDVDKIFIFDDEPHKPHNGKPITMIEISPNEKYLITYSEEDRSIVGWNVEDIDKVQLKFHKTVEIYRYIKRTAYDIYVRSLCVSDDKKLVGIYDHDNKKSFIIDMNNEDNKIALNLEIDASNYYCTFNSKGEFILYSLYVFGILNERVWKSKFDEKMSKTNFSSEKSDELNKENNKIVECDEYLNVHSFNLYNMDTVSTLFQEAIANDREESIELTGNLIKWYIHINIDDGKIKLEVFKKINTKWESISTRTENFPYKFKKSYEKHELIASSLLNNDDIVILISFVLD
ncbi:hypothetical protein GLOIN_2v1581173 [Rhizophagus irregularis DAOM 181602=DAOM 197198]|nr:hypothetical protein GLOIN_2v1581173 [Rhizophagus irregularis DAOM 181602=DAOM 197198]